MSLLSPILGHQAGPRTGYGSTPRNITWGGITKFKPGGGSIDSVKTRDPSNADGSTNIRAGLLMGSLTSGGKFTNCYAGVTTAAYSANAVSITTTVAAATELLRRNGSSGNLSLIGPPTAAGTVTNQTIAYSAINTSTGVITVSGTTTASVSGSLIGFADGSQIPDSFMNDGFPRRITNNGLGTDVPGSDIAWPDIPIEAEVNEEMLIPWPADTSLQNWIRTNLIGDPTTNPGKTNFTFRRAMNGL